MPLERLHARPPRGVQIGVRREPAVQFQDHHPVGEGPERPGQIGIRDRAILETLYSAGLRVSDINGVVMVGGSTRMPQIQKAVGEFFRQEPLNNPFEEWVLSHALLTLERAIRADALGLPYLQRRHTWTSDVLAAGRSVGHVV